MEELVPWEEIGWEGYAEQRWAFPLRKRKRHRPVLWHGQAPRRHKRGWYTQREKPQCFHLSVLCSGCDKHFKGPKARLMYRLSMHSNSCEGTYNITLIPSASRGRKKQ